MTSETLIINYLILHLPRELPGLDIWRSAVVKARTPRGYVQAGEIGQADVCGVWGGRCSCGYPQKEHAAIPELHTGELIRHPFEPAGRAVWVEVKAPGDRQKPAQKDFEVRVRRLGALYIICEVKRRETVREIAGLLGSERRPKTPLTPAVHPFEIERFIMELKGRL